MSAEQQALAACLQITMSAEKATRKQAEDQLEQFKKKPEDEQIPVHVRQAGAVFFKNLAKQHWDVDSGGEGSIGEAIKTQVRDGLLSLFLCVAHNLQMQLSEAISIIASHDFPARWPTLLPTLVVELQEALGTASKNYARGSGLLTIAHSIFKRYRHEFKSDMLYTEIKYSLDQLQAPLLALFQSSLADLRVAQGHQVKEIVHAITLMVSIHSDLCAQDLPEFMEDHMREWMEGFVKCLKYANPGITADTEESEPDSISVLQAAVVDDLSLFMSKYEEELEPYLGTQLSLVWELLVGTSLAPHHDLLVATSIRFLTTVAASVHHKLFAQPEVLQNICRKIIAPNMQLLQSDEELFEDNPFEYVRRDIEGSDAETRRRVSCELVRGLCRNYEKEVTELFSVDIAALLGSYSSNAATNWKSKDVAIYLVIALTLKGGTAKLGATHTNQLVNLMDFYGQHVLPELQVAASSGTSAPHLIIAADAIKFVSLFRTQFDVATYRQVMPLLIQLLGNGQLVVHTYAASAIERLLTVKDAATGGKCFGMMQLVPLLEPLLTKLFALLSVPGSEENQYVMRAIMRVTVVAGEAMAPYASVCIESLKGVLARVCTNPSNPTFNHYLFESVASLVRYICAATPAAVDAFEALLFPPFQQVLQLDVSEFTPYVFQVLSQLLECRPAVSVAYEGLFAPLLVPTMWERLGNIPALVRLLCVYMGKGKALVLAKLEGVLGIFQKLLATRATDGFAFQLLSAIWRCFNLDELQPYLTPIFNLILRRLQSNKKAGPAATGCWAVFVARFSAPALHAQLEAIQPNLAAMVLRGVWAEHARTVSGAMARKTVVISTTRLLLVPELLASAPDTFLALLQAAMAIVLTDQSFKGEIKDDDNAPGNFDEFCGGSSGYSAAYVPLIFASSGEVDLYPSEHATVAMGNVMTLLSASQPAFSQLLQTLPQDKREELQGLI